VTERDAEERVAARAVELFNGGLNCAESVATAVADALEPGQRSFPRLASAFGGGLGRRGENCGAVVGALLALGLARGRAEGEGDEAKARVYGCAEKIVEGFRAAHGGILCRDLAGVDLATPEGRREFQERNVHYRFCVHYVDDAARRAWQVVNG